MRPSSVNLRYSITIDRLLSLYKAIRVSISRGLSIVSSSSTISSCLLNSYIRIAISSRSILTRASLYRPAC